MTRRVRHKGRRLAALIPATRDRHLSAWLALAGEHQPGPLARGERRLCRLAARLAGLEAAAGRLRGPAGELDPRGREQAARGLLAEIRGRRGVATATAKGGV